MDDGHLAKLAKIAKSEEPTTWTSFKTLMRELDINITGALDKIPGHGLGKKRKKKSEL